MTRYPRLDRHVPSLAPALAWLLDGLRIAPAGRGPFKAPRIALQPDGRLGAHAAIGGRAAALVVPAADWLSLQISLPPVETSAQAQIAALEIADRTPFDPADLHMGWRGQGPVHLVRRATVTAALQEARTRGLTLRWLVAENDETAVIDLAPPVARPFRAALLALSLVVLSLAGITAYVLRDVMALRTTSAALTPQLALAQADGAEARALARQITELQAVQTADLPEILLPGRAPVHVLLDDLTAATPDSSYLSALEITEAGARLSGWSTAPEALVRSLETAPGVVNVRFRGPVTAGEAGFRFELMLDLEPAG
ncbi:PilN domain-containing protein [uncultured Roseobacter sp.]|uniref:PilN domain-containing protein n=1 Tax=uncultured Roseobacter sp. TaxID=114847 RepID=UPI00261D573A|nr:PilN domain-containing protein [uncultured Roseobacter sp.]